MVPIKPVYKDMLYMKVAETIYKYVRENELQAGHKIPSERELAKQLNIGRNSLREAIRILEQEGILEVKIGVGTFVASETDNSSIYAKLFKGNYDEIMDIRTILEKEAIKRAIKALSAKQIERLEAVLLIMEEKAQAGAYAHEEDNEFHGIILDANGNKSLKKLVQDLSRILNEYSTTVPQAQAQFLKTIPYHRELFEGIVSGDWEAACLAYQAIITLDKKIHNLQIMP